MAKWRENDGGGSENNGAYHVKIIKHESGINSAKRQSIKAYLAAASREKASGGIGGMAAA